MLLDPITNEPFVDDRFITSVAGIFAAGNVVHVYDLVDWVTEAGYVAGKGAAAFTQVEVPAPVAINQVVLEDAIGTGIDIVASRDMPMA